MSQILAYLRKDLQLELRRGYAMGGLIVFVLCIVYIIYLSFGIPDDDTWITLYWIAFLFVSVHTILKGFAMEQGTRYLYYFLLLGPEKIFLAKWIYHTLALSFLGLLMYAALFLVAGDPFVHRWIFILSILAGATGVSLCFTFVAAIAVKSDQSATLMTILSFPLMIPVLLHLIGLSRAAAQTGTVSIGSGLMTLAAIYLLVAGLALLLFPYLWRS